MKTEILGVPIDNVTMKEAVAVLQGFLKEEKNHIVITPNPEMVMGAQKDKEFMEILKNADLVIPDGIGVVLASKFNKVKIKNRVAGCDLCLELFENIKDKNISVYLFGGKPGVCQQAVENLEKNYPGLKIIGYHDGYFDAKEEIHILHDLETKNPDILLIGLGFPKQEKWMSKYKDILPIKISIGVGGSLDVFAGTVKRAPKTFQKLGLEWFYRLLKQPSRIGRMLQLPLFMLRVLIYKLVGRK